MKKNVFTLILASLFLVLLVFPYTTRATTIEYEVTNLPDTTSGEDLWQYTYRVSNYTFTAGHGFTIYFDQTRYKNIESPPAVVNEDWDIMVWQPDIAIPDFGAYDALAVTSEDDGASLTDAFTVSFIWTGNGTPGPQQFEICDSNFNTLESAQTVSAPMNPWDVNGDNTVNILDLVFVGHQFGTTPPDNPAADVNGDGTVDILDIVLIGQHFGESYDSNAGAR